jgi:hypothetical protein
MESERLQILQARLDQLLSGTLDRGTTEDRGVFTRYLPEHAQRASALAALCRKRAKVFGGIAGLEVAVDTLYGYLDSTPQGMVEHAAKLFMVHYQSARENLSFGRMDPQKPSGPPSPAPGL